LERKVLKNLFSKLSDLNFCTYDFRKQRVQVPKVAQVFTKLFKESGGLDPALRGESEQSKNNREYNRRNHHEKV
jgi:hypothetical protein